METLKSYKTDQARFLKLFFWVNEDKSSDFLICFSLEEIC